MSKQLKRRSKDIDAASSTEQLPCKRLKVSSDSQMLDRSGSAITDDSATIPVERLAMTGHSQTPDRCGFAFTGCDTLTENEYRNRPLVLKLTITHALMPPVVHNTSLIGLPVVPLIEIVTQYAADPYLYLPELLLTPPEWNDEKNEKSNRRSDSEDDDDVVEMPRPNTVDSLDANANRKPLSPGWYIRYYMCQEKHPDPNRAEVKRCDFSMCSITRDGVWQSLDQVKNKTNRELLVWKPTEMSYVVPCIHLPPLNAYSTASSLAMFSMSPGEAKRVLENVSALFLQPKIKTPSLHVRGCTTRKEGTAPSKVTHGDCLRQDRTGHSFRDCKCSDPVRVKSKRVKSKHGVHLAQKPLLVTTNNDANILIIVCKITHKQPTTRTTRTTELSSIVRL